MIKHIPPEDLKRDWTYYEAGIAEIIRRSNGRMTFTPRDIYRHLRQDRARLFRVGDAGFFVIEQCIETLSGEPFLNIWLMWFKPGEGVKVYQDLLKFVDKLCEFHKCEWIDFGTTRSAWVELLKGDFEEHMVTLRRKKQ